MDQIYDIYNQFINVFPESMRWSVSLVLAGLIVYAAYKVIKRNFIFIILLIVLLPASVPIFKNVWDSLVVFIKFLLTKQ